MKNKLTVVLLIILKSLGIISAQGFIKGEYKSYQYELEPRIVTEEEYNFDQDMYLSSFVSKSILDKKWHKETSVNCEKKIDNFVINISLTNINYNEAQNLNTTHCLEKKENSWNLYYENELVGIISYSKDLDECYFYDYEDKTTESFYSKKKNNYILFNTKYVLKNGIFYEQDLDGNENYNFIDGNKYSISYSYEGLRSEYKCEKQYYCTDINQTCTLWLLRNHISPFLLPYLFCKLDRAYHSTSYLTEGDTTYEPEHMQYKDGLPWASGNGKGIGEVISIKEFENKNPSVIKLLNGYQDKNHPDYYEKNSRVKKIKITNTDTKKSKTIKVKDRKEEQLFQIDDLGPGQNYDIEILAVYPGKKYNDLCIQYLVVE